MVFRQWKQDREPIISQLIETIAQVPNSGQVRHEPVVIGEFTDLTLQVMDRDLTLRVKTRKSAQMADVRGWLWQWQQDPPRPSPDVLLLVAANQLPKSCRQLLAAQGVCSFDAETGSLYLSGKGAYVYIDRTPHRRNSRAWRAAQWQKEQEAFRRRFG